MNVTNLKTLFGLMGLFCLFAVSQVNAASISPANCDIGGTDLACWTTTDNSNFDADDVETLVGTDSELEEVYKMNVGESGGTGSAAGSYVTTFNGDNSGAIIEYVGGTAITCPECYLLIKDGNQDPAQYVFSLDNVDGLMAWFGGGAWDGMEMLELSGFWPEQGAISHIAIYSANPIPLPGAVLLFGSALFGLVGFKRLKGNAA